MNNNDNYRHLPGMAYSGIEKEDWQATQEFEQMKEAVQESEASKEAGLLYGKDATYAIYQLRDGDETRNFRFESLDHIESRGLTVDRDNYNLVYSAPLVDGDTLDTLYTKFNIDPPDDFTGHSLSMSDIVVFQQDGVSTAHYVDREGFKELPDFFREYELDIVQKLAGDIDRFMYDFDQHGYDDADIDTETSIAMIADAIYSSDSYVENVRSTLEFAAEQHIPDASELLERLNQLSPPPEPVAPTVAELETQANAGKQISLLDLAHAVKTEQAQKDTDKPPTGRTLDKKPSILAQLQAAKKESAQGQNQPKNTHKRNGDMEV